MRIGHFLALHSFQKSCKIREQNFSSEQKTNKHLLQLSVVRFIHSFYDRQKKYVKSLQQVHFLTKDLKTISPAKLNEIEM